MINFVMLGGYLGKDPEIKTTEKGGKIATISMATSKRWRDKATGEQREQTSWHRIVVLNEALVEVCEKYLKKGSKAMFRGELVSRTWEDKGGERRYVTEVVLGPFHSEITLLDKREGGGVPAGGGDDYGAYGYQG
jgi:single-strand DNA-binding protein